MTALAPWALEASAVAALVLLLARPRSGPPLRSALLRLGLLKFALPPLLAWPLLPATAIAVVPGPDASPLAVVLAAVWVAGVIVVVARTAGERRALGALLRDAEPWTDRDGLSRLARLAADAGLARPPLALVSARAGAPLVGGWPRPALVLPRDWASGASAEDMELVLRHELAHLARRDLVWLELASWLAVVWWWNPLFHRVAARARAADEDACDDRALAGSRASAAEYGALLVRVAESGAMPARAAALGLHATERRLRRLFDGGRRSAVRLGAAQCLLLLTLAAALLPGLAARPAAGRPSHVHVFDSHRGHSHHHQHGH